MQFRAFLAPGTEAMVAYFRMPDVLVKFKSAQRLGRRKFNLRRCKGVYSVVAYERGVARACSGLADGVRNMTVVIENFNLWSSGRSPDSLIFAACYVECSDWCVDHFARPD